jgi:uncharacterized protein (TIGR00369 family)
MPSRIANRTYGTVSGDKQKEMTGLDFVQGLADGTLPLNTIARTLGYDITEAENGRVVVTAEPKDIHLNPAGTVHGGLAATMLDSCMGLAIQSTLEKGLGSTTLEFKISFVRPITPAISCPGMRGKERLGHCPSTVKLSPWHTPQASTRMRASPRAGSGTSRSTSSSGPPARTTCNARIFAIAASHLSAQMPRQGARQPRVEEE